MNEKAIGLLTAVGLSWAWACGSDDPKTASSPQAEAGPGSDGGDTTGTGGAAAEDAGSGGSAGEASATGGRDASLDRSVPDAAERDAEAGQPDALPVEAGGDAEAPDANGADSDSDSGGGRHPLMGKEAYPEVVYPDSNPHTDVKAMLGKILFWEEEVGELGTMACGTCHRAGAGGSDPRAVNIQARLPGPNGVFENPSTLLSDDTRGGQGVPKCAESGGVITFDEPNPNLRVVQVTGRKPPSYLDAMFAPQVFWDGRATENFTDPDTGRVFMGRLDASLNKWRTYALESQAIGPPRSDAEMACRNQTFADIHARLAIVEPLAKTKGAIPDDMKQFIVEHGDYPSMFEAAFGDDFQDIGDGSPPGEINTIRFAFAIATHERRLTSNQTPWDRWNAGDASAMTSQQVRGFELFMDKAQCGPCHGPPLFTDLNYHFVGFHKPAWDEGRYAETGKPEDRGKMKTPTLRNVGLRERGGLLHRGDGPGHDLETVMELYNRGGFVDDPDITGNGPDAGGPGIDPQIVPLDLTPAEITAIIDFLRHALTDPRVAREEPPFDRPLLGSEQP